MKAHLVIAAVLALMIAGGRAQSESGVDPIGNVKKVSTFDRAQGINVGKSATGKPVCFFREEGGSHQLDIGMSADGAFIRVAHGDGPLPAEEIPTAPLRLFAGKGLTKLVDGDEKYTGTYQPMQTYSGSIEYVSNLDTDFGSGFIVFTKEDAKSFLEMVAHARGEFVVVQSEAKAKRLDRVAIYHFSVNAIPALLSCAKQHVR